MDILLLALLLIQEAEATPYIETPTIYTEYRITEQDELDLFNFLKEVNGLQ